MRTASLGPGGGVRVAVYDLEDIAASAGMTY
jgi:hypothetical protein